MTEKIIKPLFKYIGGKSWLRNSLRQSIELVLPNNKITTYCEPFTGGLGSFINVYDLLIKNNIQSVQLSDINSTLISIYQFIHSNPDDFIKEFIKIEYEFSLLTKPEWKNIKDKHILKNLLINCETYFNKIKKEFNENKNLNNIEQGARLLFLQKHSFNGIYRENSKGYYNTPFNWSPYNMLDTIELKVKEINSIFNLFDISFSTQSFDNINYNLNTLYYLDPPYINETSQENKYNKNCFNLNEQLLLIQKIKNSHFIYSNHKNELLLNSFNNNIKIIELERKNLISPNSNSRKNNKTEILVISH